MAKKDAITKNYIGNNRIFADAFNYLLYNGKQRIHPEQLHSMDTTALGVPYGKQGEFIPIQKFRDAFKYVTAMEDGKTAYLLLGIENQSQIHYAMPVRNMLYDALQYAAQVEETARMHRRKGKTKDARQDTSAKPNAGEYLSGFYKSDKLLPVVTLVIYFGADKWDAPRDLHGMLSIVDEKVLEYVPNYKINLIVPAEMEDEELDRFSTSLREVLLFIKYSEDHEKLNELIHSNEHFNKMEREATMLINAITNSALEFDEEEENVDVCGAIKGIREDGRAEGRLEGRSENQREIALRMLAKGKYALEEIAELTDFSIDDIERLQSTIVI